MLLSTFSHFSLFHMAANMYVLWSFSSSIVSLLGCEQFIAVYLSAGNVKYIYLQHIKICIHANKVYMVNKHMMTDSNYSAPHTALC